MNSYKVSVIVLTYNASWERIRATLNSVILQKGIEFELIVADDCSDNNYFNRIKDFFSRHSFNNYMLIAHEQNVGTVLNMLDGAKKSSGRYVRALGQGDIFFDEYVLRDSYNFIAEQKAVCAASKTVHYQAASNPVKLLKHTRVPRNIEAFKDPDMLRESYLIKCDSASGASMIYERENLIEYLSEIAGKGMKYIEDFMIWLMVFDKKKICFFNRNTIYYELGAGLSSSSMNDTVTKGLFSDGDIYFKMLFERCRNSPSDEFSSRLSSSLTKRLKAAEAEKLMNSKPKIIAVPVRLAKFLAVSFMRLKRRLTSATTDINVPADFANLCMNRE